MALQGLACPFCGSDEHHFLSVSFRGQESCPFVAYSGLNRVDPRRGCGRLTEKLRSHMKLQSAKIMTTEDFRLQRYTVSLLNNFRSSSPQEAVLPQQHLHLHCWAHSSSLTLKLSFLVGLCQLPNWPSPAILKNKQKKDYLDLLPPPKQSLCYSLNSLHGHT